MIHYCGEDYFFGNSGLKIINRYSSDDISVVRNVSILEYWIKTDQIKEEELCDEQRLLLGLISIPLV